MKQEIPEEVNEVFISKENVVSGVEGLLFDRTTYTNFDAEVCLGGKEHDDYIVHFYFPQDRPNDAALKKYWLEIFPVFLDRIAQEHFNAGPERMKAAYTEENASWWFRAYGLANGLDPESKIKKFFTKLSQSISTAGV